MDNATPAAADDAIHRGRLLELSTPIGALPAGWYLILWVTASRVRIMLTDTSSGRPELTEREWTIRRSDVARFRTTNIEMGPAIGPTPPADDPLWQAALKAEKRRSATGGPDRRT